MARKMHDITGKPKKGMKISGDEMPKIGKVGVRKPKDIKKAPTSKW